MASIDALNEALKDLYYPALVEQLNSPILYTYGPSVPASWYHERGLPLPWVYVPPAWHIRKWRHWKWHFRSGRERLGRWIAGVEERDWMDD